MARLTPGALAKRADPAAPEATDTPQQQTVAGYLNGMAPQFARALGDVATADRLVRIALTEIRKTPQLALCTPESFMGALMTCAQLGIEPGPLGEAYLLPINNGRTRKLEVQFILGYKGMATLFSRHPLAANLRMETVREGDEWDYSYGLNEVLRHVPANDDDRPNRPVLCYYAVGTLLNGGYRFIVLTKADVERRRLTSKQPNGFGWANNYDAMGMKSAIRALFTLLPKTPQITQALMHDETVRTDIDPAKIDEVPPEPDPFVIDAPAVSPEGEPAADPIAGEVVTPAALPAPPTVNEMADRAVAAGLHEAVVFDNMLRLFGDDADAANLTTTERSQLWEEVQKVQPPKGKTGK
jgi:recombination protein RecT